MTSQKEKQDCWLNLRQAAQSLEISDTAFSKWKVRPVARIGRESFFTMRDVLDNRLQHQLESQRQKGDEDAEGLEFERLRLTRAQADGQEIKNEISRGKTAPIEIVQVVLSRIAGEAAGELDSIPLNIKRKNPDIDNLIIEDIKRHCVKAQNAIARCDDTLDDVLDDYITDTTTG